MLRWAIALGLLVTATAAQATSVSEFWQSRPVDSPTFQSARSTAALELCLGMAFSDYVPVPQVLRGERETVITLVAGTTFRMPVGGVRILDQGARRTIIVGALGSGGWTKRISRAVESCA